MIQSVFRNFLDWPAGTFLSVVSILVIALILWMGATTFYYVGDFIFTPTAEIEGRVIGKKFVPADTKIILMYSAATKTSLPHPIKTSARWTAEVDYGISRGFVDVDNMLYGRIEAGSHVMASYITGRFSKKINLVSIRLM